MLWTSILLTVSPIFFLLFVYRLFDEINNILPMNGMTKDQYVLPRTGITKDRYYQGPVLPRTGITKQR